MTEKERKETEIKETIDLLRKRELFGLSKDRIIELCFEVLEQSTDVVDQCFAATILSGRIRPAEPGKPGLGDEAKQFLKKNPHLPKRVHEVLEGNYLRMNCF